jgi:hypothetical protein
MILYDSKEISITNVMAIAITHSDELRDSPSPRATKSPS